MQPTKIKLINHNYLLIRWEDNSETKIELSKLRRLCPCATCLAERDQQSKNYIPIYSSSQIKVSEIQPVGSYAIGITWQDGHNTGIYEYPFLSRLSLNEITPGKE